MKLNQNLYDKLNRYRCIVFIFNWLITYSYVSYVQNESDMTVTISGGKKTQVENIYYRQDECINKLSFEVKKESLYKPWLRW